MSGLKRLGAVAPVHARDVRNSVWGLGFEKLDRNVFDPGKAYDKVAALGVKWIRIQSGWARTERSEGVYDFAWLDSIVDNLVSRVDLPLLRQRHIRRSGGAGVRRGRLPADPYRKAAAGVA